MKDYLKNIVTGGNSLLAIIENIQRAIINDLENDLKVSELNGFEGGEKVVKWFKENTDHPHPQYTFDQMAMNRKMSLDHKNYFAQDLINTMSYLVAQNIYLIKMGE